MCLYLCLLKSGVKSVGVGGEGVGVGEIGFYGFFVFWVELVGMGELEVFVGIDAIDVEYACFDLDGVAGKSADAMEKEGFAGFRGDGVIGDEAEVFGFFESGDEGKAAAPEGRFVGRVRDPEKF